MSRASKVLLNHQYRMHSLYSYRNLLKMYQSLFLSLCLHSAPQYLCQKYLDSSRRFHGEALRIPKGLSSFEITWERTVLYSELKGSLHDNVFHYSDFFCTCSIVQHFFHKLSLWGFTFICKYSTLGSVFNLSIKFLQSQINCANIQYICKFCSS